MKRLVVAVAALAIVAALVPALSSARTLSQRVKALENKVRVLQAKTNCLRRTGAASFVGYAFYEGTLEINGGPYPVHDPAEDFRDTGLAANFVQAVGGTPDYWLVAVKDTRSCRSKYRGIASPYARASVRTQRLTALQRLARAQ